MGDTTAETVLGVPCTLSSGLHIIMFYVDDCLPRLCYVALYQMMWWYAGIVMMHYLSINAGTSCANDGDFRTKLDAVHQDTWHVPDTRCINHLMLAYARNNPSACLLYISLACAKAKLHHQWPGWEDQRIERIC